MKHDEVNTIVDNILTQEEISQIYEAVENKSGSAFVEPHCQLNYFIKLPDSVVEKFTNHARVISGNDNLVLTEYCYAIYKNTIKDDVLYRPSLFPHYDETFKEPRFTFDYQLNANIHWPIVVEPEKEFIVLNNQAVTFSGTHQIHWRVPTLFQDTDFVEMIFCHFSDPSSGAKGEDLNKIMDAKASEYKKQFFDNGGFTNGRIA
jgi:hypothetical protein